MEEATTDRIETPESSTGQSIEETAEQEVQVQDSPTEQPAETAGADTATSLDPQPEQMNQPLGVDDGSVNWKNQYYAQQRQLDKVLEQQNALLEKVDQNQGQQRGEYSIEELEAFAETTDNAQHRTWAKSEIRKLEKKEFESILESKLTEKEKAVQAEQTRQAVFNEVAARHPEAFQRNAQGQVVGWDPKSPMAQRIAQHMQDPEIKNNPRGLRVASALAFQELGSNIAAQAAKKTVQAKAEVKNLQKKTLTEGGGVSSPPAPKTPLSAAREKLNSTGSVKDGAAAFKEILKKRGRISED